MVKDLKRLNAEMIEGDAQTCKKKKPQANCARLIEKNLSKGVGDNSTHDRCIVNSAPVAHAQSDHYSLNHVMACFQGDGPGIVVGRAEERDGKSSSEFYFQRAR